MPVSPRDAALQAAAEMRVMMLLPEPVQEEQRHVEIILPEQALPECPHAIIMQPEPVLPENQAATMTPAVTTNN